MILMFVYVYKACMKIELLGSVSGRQRNW